MEENEPNKETRSAEEHKHLFVNLENQNKKIN